MYNYYKQINFTAGSFVDSMFTFKMSVQGEKLAAALSFN